MNGVAMGSSPKQIAGRPGCERGRTVIRPQSIYRFIHHDRAQKILAEGLLPFPHARPYLFSASRISISNSTSVGPLGAAGAAGFWKRLASFTSMKIAKAMMMKLMSAVRKAP